MAERLPSVTYRQIQRAIERDGWQLARRGSRHDIYTHDSKPGIVPLLRHPTQTAKEGTLRSIIAQAGLTPESFRRLL
ncbi:MAG: type II toxin-antitoxin system HicA family toxin [Dehalococcoidia bacterium]